MAANITSLISTVCGIVIKILDILKARGKTNDKEDRISKYTDIADRLFSDDKSN